MTETGRRVGAVQYNRTETISMMGSIEDYSSGKILGGISKALAALDEFGTLTREDDRIDRVIENIKAFEPECITQSEAATIIRDAHSIALGERVCRALHPESEPTQSVFLDELADAMIRSGRAGRASAEDAERALRQHSGHPLIISMVSGRHQEICASHRETCVFWKAENRGVRCLKRRQTDGEQYLSQQR
ncbi:MAG TPA: hypothetical protein VN371_10040 [Chlorobaculum sp.]|nr:hypothetical protein [Chlorobaculum sp.]